MSGLRGLPDASVIVRSVSDLGPQEYRLVVEQASSGAVIEAADALAVRFAMGELAQSVWRDGDGPPSLHVADPGEVRRPMAPHRTCYFNVAFGFSKEGITADTWSDEQWRSVIEWLLDCRYSRIAFYLWADSGLGTNASTIDRERNLEVRRRLATAMAYAQAQGMQVAFWFTPSNMPRDLLAGHEELLAPAPYPPGYPTLCPSLPGSLDLMAQVYAEELAWFAGADAFQVWFYDPGGCWCERCRSRPAQAAVDQLRRLAPVVATVAPDAALEVSAWPVWANEKEFGVTYREAFVAELSAWAAEYGRRVTVLDTPESPTNVLADLGRAGLGQAAFYLNTNVETGWCFFQPSLPMVEQIRDHARAGGYDDVVVMRIEEGTRWPQDAIVGLLLWSPEAETSAVLRSLARGWVGTRDGGDQLAEAMLAWDELLWLGAEKSDVRLTPLVEGIDLRYATRPLGMLVTSARALDLLADAARGGVVEPSEVAAVLAADPATAPLAAHVECRFDAFVDWVRRGWGTAGAF